MWPFDNETDYTNSLQSPQVTLSRTFVKQSVILDILSVTFDANTIFEKLLRSTS